MICDTGFAISIFCDDNLIAKPSDDDLASLAGEGMLGAVAAKRYTKVRAGEGDAAP